MVPDGCWVHLYEWGYECLNPRRRNWVTFNTTYMTCCITHQLKVCVNRFLELFEYRTNYSVLISFLICWPIRKQLPVYLIDQWEVNSDLSSVSFSKKMRFQNQKFFPILLSKDFEIKRGRIMITVYCILFLISFDRLLYPEW